ncbi:beta-galactosidase [Streptomyces longwoodensis]|uniref:glycoside hydrolase family 2 protein n=1 Tax=Streptomyces longwoodensis TaxID=68231 RepID=UPI00224EDC13|nr:sugar-binding domain-containing protein [Streptomyces longwoodensis]MCX4997668.1 beta-galactosidase [Streptomyces longwoodensis]WUC56203.1 beta-galactosidase [Streptomyces longwoodensis]
MPVPHPSDLPRPEYPRPQFVRDAWLNLNGTWQFQTDRSDSGLERGLTGRALADTITVPFCPESALSGIGDTDFLEAVWYRRTVTVPAEWAGSRVLLHFGAVDHDTTVWVNGVEVARHRGGFTPFTADLDGVAEPGAEATVVVRARDTRHGPQARGKQATWYANSHCHYTRTTGIWQTVWMEPVPRSVALKRPRITPDVASGSFFLELPLTANLPGHRVRAVLSDASGEVTAAGTRADLDLAPRLVLTVPDERVRLWAPEDPHLYGLRLEVLDADGTVVDAADSYAGLRSVAVRGRRVLINGRPVFQRLVLDQGYWPESLMTAPSDEALVRDIELGLAAGFNGARLHQKVFEERYLYHADRLGYLVWGEFGDWGCETGERDDNQRPDASYVAEWLEAVERDYSHPSIVGWCPLNETYQHLHDRITRLDDVTRAMFLATKQADPTRPVIDASGYAHRVPETDVYDSHCYEQDPAAFAKTMSGLAEGRPYVNSAPDGRPWSVPYRGQPYFCSEFGGIWWDPQEAARASGNEADASWGYGERPRTEEEFLTRFEGLTGVLLDDPDMFGYCYTQLTDVFQEQNGLYRFDRSVKLDVERIRRAQTRPAAYERG